MSLKMDKPFQRKGSESNTKVGRDFEAKALQYFFEQGLKLKPKTVVDIGLLSYKPHEFDLGDNEAKILVECKSHKWTEGRNVPGAKMTEWNEAMFLFLATPAYYRKILFVLRDFSHEKNMTLAEYYIQTNSHLIPGDVEIWEFDEVTRLAKRIK